MTTQIVENVLKEARKHNAKKVVEVHLAIGKLTFLGVEQVSFSYDVLVKGTIMDSSRLFIEETDGTVRCANCGYEGSFKYEADPVHHVQIPTLLCPKCGNTVKIVGGRECTIKSVKLVV